MRQAGIKTGGSGQDDPDEPDKAGTTTTNGETLGAAREDSARQPRRIFPSNSINLVRVVRPVR
ncbi:MAG: hypothetical protein KGL38_04460, partial [Gemmatimonadota bacterium]|nr:hypothetical protein [Gemmatimonadota bacterium]